MSRFALYDEEEEEDEKEAEEISKKKNAKKTEDATNFAIRVFDSFCRETRIAGSNITIDDLPSILKKFYLCVRNEKGTYYKLNSMRSLRSSLQRHFLALHKIDVIHDVNFIEANVVFENVCKKIKSIGLGDTNHHDEVEPEDMSKLYHSFDVDIPVGLQEFIWFHVVYIFIRGGRENLHSMKKDTFAINTDASGLRFIYQVEGELDKNHCTSDNSFDTPGEGRLYETGGEKCPVRLFELYLSKLNPKHNALWQKPKQLKFGGNEATWYCNVAVGVNTLGNMMSNLSTKYNLSQRYTNHCLRVTGLQVLDDAQIEGRHIIRVSGHKRTDSVENNARKLSAAKKRKISGILTGYCSNSVAIKCENESMSSTTSVSDKVVIESVDISDKEMADIPEYMLNNKVNFAPVINNCTNVTFNIHIHRD